VNPLVTLRIAVRALGRNKLRSFLTTLGVVIGVGAVIAMVAIGEGAKERVRQTYASLGTNLLIIQSGSSSSGGARGGFGSQPTLTWDDLTAIQDANQVETVKYAAPLLRTSSSIVSEQQNWTTQVYGTTADYFPLRGWKMAQGSFFSAADDAGAAKVVVMGQTVVEKLWGPGFDPLNPPQTVRIKGSPYEVVGVYAKLGQSPQGQDQDDSVFIPDQTYLSKVSGGLHQFISGQIYVASTTSETTAKTERLIDALLRDRHHIAFSRDPDFSIRNMAELAAAQQAGSETLSILLTAIAAVSLLVGGIGIMNIMLVSVTERTREIGVRMAIGAKRKHILSQFLVEAMVLSLLGGLIGIGSGMLTAHELSVHKGWPIIFQPQIIVIAVGFSALIGIGFGLYPARKASRLDPIEALRYE
jgi:putative ABC transport system permease protein